MMDTERMLFEKGCFLPNWLDDEPQEAAISQVHNLKNKDLNTLLEELESIKQHLEDVKERQWQLAKLLHFHKNGFARE